MIYGIFSGEYSDWNCHGYFDKLEDAEKYCTFMNTKESETYYIENIEKLECLFDKDSVVPMYKYMFNENFDDLWKNAQGTLSTDSICKNFVYSKYNFFRDMKKYEITVYLPEKNSREKALKIAQDLFTQWKYENELDK